MTPALLCSGQGLLHPGMFALTGGAPEAAGLFAQAATLLGGRDPRDFVRREPAAALHHDRAGQILCTLQALAAAAALREVLQGGCIVAGYSVGEMAAWGVAGYLGMADTLDLAARRADAMDAASSPGDGLLFVRGLGRDAIDALCARHGAAIAIVNPGDAFVLGGSGAALDAVAAEAQAMNAARIVRLAVEVASHTRRLAAASASFRETLRHVPVTLAPGARLLSGVDGAAIVDAGAGLDKLAAQISHTVRWADCLQSCIEAGATAFLELGPGGALAAMAAGAYPDVPARSLDDFRSLEGVRAWLARGG
ncbi:MAG: acyltransferase domain-containing protein [Rhizomicrobium sp.]